jgi:hypothetical protein
MFDKKNRLLFLACLVSISLLITGCIKAAEEQPQPTDSNLPEYPYPAPAIITPMPYPPGGEAPSMPVGIPQPYPEPGDTNMNPFAPVPQDASLEKANAFLDESQVLTLESQPPQYTLTLKGSLPTPCHYLRVQISEPDAQNRIQVLVYSVVDPNMICAQVLQPFDASITIPTPPSGQTYTVWVNEAQIAEIQW